MKRNLLGLAAVVLAIAVSSFTTKWNTVFYYVYSTGSHSSAASYQTPTQTAQSQQTGDAVLAWISLESVNSQIDANEFSAAFEALDIEEDATNSLNDDFEGSQTFTFNGTSNLEARLEKKD